MAACGRWRIVGIVLALTAVWLRPAAGASYDIFVFGEQVTFFGGDLPGTCTDGCFGGGDVEQGYVSRSTGSLPPSGAPSPTLEPYNFAFLELCTPQGCDSGLGSWSSPATYVMLPAALAQITNLCVPSAIHSGGTICVTATLVGGLGQSVVQVSGDHSVPPFEIHMTQGAGTSSDTMAFGPLPPSSTATITSSTVGGGQLSGGGGGLFDVPLWHRGNGPDTINLVLP